MRREIKGQVFDTEKDNLIYETWKNSNLSANYEFEILYKFWYILSSPLNITLISSLLNLRLFKIASFDLAL